MGRLGLTPITIMAISPTNGVTGSPGSNLASGTFLPSKELTQRDFLKLLVAQMTTQDPLKPIENQDLLTQTVQFSTLQQNANFQVELSRLQASQSFLQANSLLGREVTLQTGVDTTEQGLVTAVDLVNGTPQIVVNGTIYNLVQVLTISPAPTGTGTST